MGGNLRQIGTESEFERLLGTSDKPVLVDLTATWCGPCQRLTPILEQFADEYGDRVEVVAVDADSPRALSWRLGGDTIPRLYLFDRGALQLMVAGVRDLAWLGDVVGGYPDLEIDVPDGPPLAPRSPARRFELPASKEGQAAAFLIHGHDDGFTHNLTAPCEVDASAGSTTRLMVSRETIAAGYLEQLDPDAFDELLVVGEEPLTPDDLRHLTHLTGLRRITGVAAVAPSDLGVLAGLPRLSNLALHDAKHQRIAPEPAALPGLMGSQWIAPSLLAARATAGLSTIEAAEHDDDAFEVACISKRGDDGNLDFVVHVTVADGWYAFPPGSEEGLPVTVTVTSDHVVLEPLTPIEPADRLTGRASLRAVLAGPSEEVRLDVRVQVCDGDSCVAPRTLSLVVPTTSKR